jgi:hypothetical protein
MGGEAIDVVLDVELDANGVWPGIRKAEGVKLLEGGAELAAIWTTRLAPGEPTIVALRIDLGGGRVAIVETTVHRFLAIADAMRKRYGDEHAIREAIRVRGHCGRARCVPIDDGSCYCACAACDDARAR